MLEWFRRLLVDFGLWQAGGELIEDIVEEVKEEVIEAGEEFIKDKIDTKG